MSEAARDDDRALVDPRRLDASALLVRAQGLSDADVDEITDLFHALRRWHRTSAAHSEASRRYMRLGENDMRAIRYVMSAARDGAIVTSTMIAEHLGITGPSVTKLLDRLEHAGHIRRERHPRDRRSLSIVVTDETRAGEGVRRRRSRAALRRRRRPLAGGAPGRDEVPQPARGPARRRAPCR